MRVFRGKQPLTWTKTMDCFQVMWVYTISHVFSSVREDWEVSTPWEQNQTFTLIFHLCISRVTPNFLSIHLCVVSAFFFLIFLSSHAYVLGFLNSVGVLLLDWQARFSTITMRTRVTIPFTNKQHEALPPEMETEGEVGIKNNSMSFWESSAVFHS